MKNTKLSNLSKVTSFLFVMFLFCISCKDDNVEPLLNTTIPQDLERALITSNLPYELDGAGGAYHPMQLAVKFQPGVDEVRRNFLLVDVLGAIGVRDCMCGDVLSMAIFDEEGLKEGGLEGVKQKGESENEIEELSFNYYNFNESITFTPPVITGNPIDFTFANSDIIAIVDVGLDYSENTLIGNKIAGNTSESSNALDNDDNCLVDDVMGWDFVNNDNDPTDDHGHGTHVANIILTESNSLNPANGTPYDFLPIKTHNERGIGTLFNVSCGIIYAGTKGADVINASWGFYAVEEPTVLKQAMVYANSISNSIIVTSYGNDSIDLDDYNHYPSGFDLDFLIGVGATDPDFVGKAPFSNYYSSSLTNLYAPGSNITSTMPIWYSTSTEIKSGTSMSCASMTAAVAQVLLDCGTTNGATILSEIKDDIPVQNETVSGNNLDYVIYNSFDFDPCP